MTSTRLNIVIIGAFVVGYALCGVSDAFAFDYLEHSFFSDYACREVQGRIAERLAESPEDDQLAARYLALAMVCPTAWERPYCVDGYKQATASVNVLEEPPWESGDYAITLGDYAALPDHLSRFGPIRRLPRARSHGLVWRTLEWLTSEPGSAGTVIEDVGEDACETDDLVPWEVVHDDVDQVLRRGEQGSRYRSIPGQFLGATARAAIPQGPSDPTARYSFDNPHYLDLVLRNHTHFGPQAYQSWVGFHSTAIDMSRRECTDLIVVDADEAEDLADDVPGWEGIDWDELDERQLRERMCAMLRDRIADRIAGWADAAPDDLLDPVREEVDLATDAEPTGGRAIQQRRFLDRVSTALLGLVFEGSGLHFLQDGFAGGHMRTLRSREALLEVRHDHDLDNRDGVVAVLQTSEGATTFLAFGDGYLLGPSLPGQRSCDWDALSQQDDLPPATITNCLVQYQRGVIVTGTMGSLLDWALDGPMFGAQLGSCEDASPLHRFVCESLPVTSTKASGEEIIGLPNGARFHGPAALPVPPPDFSYESLIFRYIYEVDDGGARIGARLALLEELGHRAHWLTSYRMGVEAGLGERDDAQWLADFAYGFHFRWSARFTLDAAPFVFAGLRGQADDVEFITGFGPTVGVTALPEGWIKLPLEVGVSYRLPLLVYASNDGFFTEDVVDAHQVQVSFGFAFMH